MASNRKEIIARAKHKKSAYVRCFMGDDGELSPSGKLIIGDLKNLSKADQSPTMVSPISGMVDPIASAHRAGLQEMYNYILQRLYLSDKTIINLEEEP